MFVVRDVSQAKEKLQPIALTIGNFDGVHLGHRHIFHEVKKIAKEKNILSAILTFEPHPFSFFKPESAGSFRINNFAEKLRIMRENEIDRVFTFRFNQNSSQISAKDFIEKIIVEALNTKHLIVGHDFTFGKNREGNFDVLKEASEKFNFELTKISALSGENEIYSSSLVRSLIREGNILKANKILGRNFSLSGIVNEGRKLASQLGFPTANIKPKSDIVKPKFGVYKTQTFIPFLGKKFPSITNFGIKPTLEKSDAPIFETHIPNFSENLYGKKIAIEFLDFIREEKKFSSLEELKNQIARDISEIKFDK